jgi:hypothetical protein
MSFSVPHTTSYILLRGYTKIYSKHFLTRMLILGEIKGKYRYTWKFSKIVTKDSAINEIDSLKLTI